jgi:hypothetical protein
MIIGKSAARSSRRNVEDRPKTMCRQKLRNEVRKRGNPLYLAFLIGRTKSTLHYAFFAISLNKQRSLSRCFDCEQRSPSARSRLAFSRRGPCVPSRSALGRRMLFIRFVNRAVQAVWRSHHDGWKQARDSGHSPFRGPARGRSPRARISLLAPFQRTGSSTDSRSFAIGTMNHRAGFSFSLCVTLAPKPIWKSVSLIHIRCKMLASLRATTTIAHNMLDRLAIRRPHARNADYFLTRSSRLAAASHNASRTLTSPCLVIRPS